MELEQDLSGLRKRGLGLAAISYDSVAVLKNFADRKKITYSLLSDPDSKIIRAFGILNTTVKPGTTQVGIPYPGTFLVDTKGKILSKYFDDDMRERVSASDILAGRFGALASEPRRTLEAKHVGLTAGASTPISVPGHRILLSLELNLGPKMHVYAPGVTGYIPIDWQLEATGVAKAFPVQYPPAQKVHLKVINETVLVYRGRVRITREITFGQENSVKPQVTPSGELVLKGSLRYQACDDRECYLPETAPLEWRFHFQAMERERVPAELQRKAQ